MFPKLIIVLFLIIQAKVKDIPKNLFINTQPAEEHPFPYKYLLFQYQNLNLKVL